MISNPVTAELYQSEPIAGETALQGKIYYETENFYFPCQSVASLNCQLPIPNSQLIMLLYRLFAIALCVLLASCQKPEMPQGTIAKVERILSGQTIEVISTADKIALLEQIRLIGIDAPDFQQQPWGEAAKQRLEQLIGGKQVLLESDIEEKDQFDRKLAYLWQDGILLNEQLVKEGYVLASGRSRNTKYQQRLLNAQEWARLMGKGLWNPERALRQTPAEFRQQNQQK